MLERIKEVSEAARLIPYGQGKYSQLGEDVILKYISTQLEISDGGVFVDIGAGDGKSMSNSYLFRDWHWTVRAYDAAHENDFVEKYFFNQESAEGFLVLIDSDWSILSIDIDGQDYWILQKLLNEHWPDIICLEFNGCIQQERPATVPLDDTFVHDGTDYYGANLAAFKQLLSDYTLVFHHHSQNAFFVHKSFNAPEFTEPVQRVQYHPHDMTEREWVYL